MIDDVVVSTRQGSTSFEADGNTLDGWVAPIAGPDGSADNPNTWIASSFVPAVPGLGASALVSFDRQPEILAFQAGDFGPYPFAASGGIVDNVEVFFALENQTRPTYSPFFFGGPEGNDFVVVHELATSGTATAWRSMPGSTSGSTRASPRTPSGCGARTNGSIRRNRSSIRSPRSRPRRASGVWRSAIRVRTPCSTSPFTGAVP